MVKAELKYNPYLLETIVKFNGQEARINSLVEKYKGDILQNWIDKIPGIFHDEMNGFDFELEFTGTQLDFDDLKDAFASKGITENSVKLSHINTLDDRKSKDKLINDLLEWLKNNLNESFDYNKFIEDNNDLLYGNYQLVIFGNHQFDTSLFNDLYVSVDYIDSLEEIENVDLVNTPIVVCVDSNDKDRLRNNIGIILSKNNVSCEQIFFKLGDKCNPEYAEITIKDSGINNPQIIEDLNDPALLRYIEIYPVTEYIRKSIKLFKVKTDELSVRFDENTRFNEADNVETLKKIKNVGIQIGRLKTAVFGFENRDDLNNLDWNDLKQDYLAHIENWKSKKIKMTKEDEANNNANEFQNLLRSKYDIDFVNSINSRTDEYTQKILNDCRTIYTSAGLDVDWEPKAVRLDSPVQQGFCNLIDALISSKSENLHEYKDDFLGKIMKKYTDEDEVRVETVYYYNDWREEAKKRIEPLLDYFIENNKAYLLSLNEELVKKYIEHLNSLIDSQEKKKDELQTHLTGTDNVVQHDNDWLSNFKEKLFQIARR